MPEGMDSCGCEEEEGGAGSPPGGSPSGPLRSLPSSDTADDLDGDSQGLPGSLLAWTQPLGREPAGSTSHLAALPSNASRLPEIEAAADSEEFGNDTSSPCMLLGPPGGCGEIEPCWPCSSPSLEAGAGRPPCWGTQEQQARRSRSPHHMQQGRSCMQAAASGVCSAVSPCSPRPPSATTSLFTSLGRPVPSLQRLQRVWWPPAPRQQALRVKVPQMQPLPEGLSAADCRRIVEDGTFWQEEMPLPEPARRPHASAAISSSSSGGSGRGSSGGCNGARRAPMLQQHSGNLGLAQGGSQRAAGPAAVEAAEEQEQQQSLMAQHRMRQLRQQAQKAEELLDAMRSIPSKRGPLFRSLSAISTLSLGAPRSPTPEVPASASLPSAKQKAGPARRQRAGGRGGGSSSSSTSWLSWLFGTGGGDKGAASRVSGNGAGCSSSSLLRILQEPLLPPAPPPVRAASAMGTEWARANGRCMLEELACQHGGCTSSDACHCAKPLLLHGQLGRGLLDGGHQAMLISSALSAAPRVLCAVPA